MSHMAAQQHVASFIKSTSAAVKPYFWRLSGDAPNSLCRFLGVDEEELKSVLRLCKVYKGEKDNFSKNNFELLVLQCETDWTTYRLNGKAERFIRLGHGDSSEVVLPKDQYDAIGTLSYYPVEDENVRSLRTKSQRFPKMLGSIASRTAVAVDVPAKESPMNKKQVEEDISPKSLLYSFVQELVFEAGKSGDGIITARAQRKLQASETDTCIRRYSSKRTATFYSGEVCSWAREGCCRKNWQREDIAITRENEFQFWCCCKVPLLPVGLPASSIHWTVLK
jgi:hypothetical protein